MPIKNLLKKATRIIGSRGLGSLTNICFYKYITLHFLPATVVNRPVWAQIEITNACNLKCKMCAHSTHRWQSAMPPRMMSMAEFKAIIDQLPYITYALLNDVGEPLLNPELIAMIDYANGKGIKTGFFTNATLMTPDMSRRLITAEGLININASMDGGRPETFESIRIGASFTKICSHLQTFGELKKQMDKATPHLSVWMVATQETIEEIYELIRVLEDIGVTHLNVKNIMENEETEGTRLPSEDLRLLESYKETAARRNVVLSYDKMPAGNCNRPDTRTCVDPWRMVYVNVEGWINPCCYSFGDKDTYFGNILQDGLKNIWNLEAYRQFRRQLREKMPPVCIKCPQHSAQLVAVRHAFSVEP